MLRVVPIITVKGRARAARCRRGQHPYQRPAACHPGIPAGRNATCARGHASEAAATPEADQGMRSPIPRSPRITGPIAQPGPSMRALVPRPGKKSSTSARRAGSIIIAAAREATSFRRGERRGPERHDWPQLGMLCERHQQISKPTLAKLSEKVDGHQKHADELKAINYSTM